MTISPKFQSREIHLRLIDGNKQKCLNCEEEVERTKTKPLLKSTIAKRDNVAFR